ncbi:uncharacterized protein BJ212DRAFT_784925 [Suillus subaureus]|uniref:DUF5648 domain-containing protein n=1 Tax=Suillus subaureus TaxID=48587 RepID=A0A9P7DYF6_9AGAM|nr:uncharacterized protein BJ212DRAFT_784925 [Suillus subaureus]KAG1806174.1 hypothetical protein BJ212DRAFT_784925 [Suillus subaureus]
MKASGSIPFFALFVAFTRALTSTPQVKLGDVPSAGCLDSRLAVDFLRAYQPKYVDHFYTTNASETNNAVFFLGYSGEGVAAYVFPWYLPPDRRPSTVPLYRMYNPKVIDHFYTTSYSEVQSAKSLGYDYEEISAYVYNTNICGSVALYRLYSSSGTDHFYTTSASEASNAVAKLGYTEEGIVCYVLPVPPWPYPDLILS